MDQSESHVEATPTSFLHQGATYKPAFPAIFVPEDSFADLRARSSNEEPRVLFKRACPSSTDVDCGNGLCCNQGDRCLPADGSSGSLCAPNPLAFSTGGFKSVYTAFSGVSSSSISSSVSTGTSLTSSASFSSLSTSSNTIATSSTSTPTGAGASATARPGPRHDHGLSGGAIAGIVVGALVAAVLLSILLFYILWRRRKRHTQAEFDAQKNPVGGMTHLRGDEGVGGPATTTATASGGSSASPREQVPPPEYVNHANAK